MEDSLSPDNRIPSARPAAGSPFAVAIAVTVLVPIVMYTVASQVLREVSPEVGFLMTALASLVFLGVSLWSLRLAGIPLAAIGLTPAKGIEALWMVLAVWGLYGLMLVALLLAENPSLAGLFENSPQAIIKQWLFVGVAEEVLFRGFFLTWLRERFGRLGKTRAIVAAVLLSSLIFSLYHIPARLYELWQEKMGIYVVGYSLFLLVLMAVLFAYVYLRTGNILFAALVHGGSNCRLIGAPKDVIPLVVLIVVIELVAFLRRRSRSQQPAKG